MGNFFSGLAQTAVHAAPFAAQVLAQREAKEEADRQRALAQLHQQNQDSTASMLANVQAGVGLANIGHLNAETTKLNEPIPSKRVYDPTRGVMVNETDGTFAPIAGLPDKPVPPKAPGNIDPLSDAGIAAGAKRAGAVAAAEAPFKKDPNAPPASASRSVATITKALATNQETLSYIDRAIEAVQKHPDAFGLEHGRGLPILGGIIDQRLDPAGVEARSLVANVGSQQIHDRTGAAMSVHEEKRLSPFVPGNSDTPEKILTNLRQLRDGLTQNNTALQNGGNVTGPPPNVPHPSNRTNVPPGNVNLGGGHDSESAWAAKNPPKRGESFEQYHARYVASQGGEE